jgi:hypothetical protein
VKPAESTLSGLLADESHAREFGWFLRDFQHPFLPVRKDPGQVSSGPGGAHALNWSIQLQRGVVTHHYQVTPRRLTTHATPTIEYLSSACAPRRSSSRSPSRARRTIVCRGSCSTHKAVSCGAIRTRRSRPTTGMRRCRERIELKRAFNYARDARGRAWLWIRRRKTTGRGEGASGLRFDVIRRGRG